MKKKSMISFGPGASSLILIFVVLALSVLGILSLMNSRNDIRLSERSVQVTQAVYALQTAAEEKRAALDALLCQAALEAGGQEAYESAIAAALPEDVEWADGVLSWEETDGFRSLNCALETQPLDAQERTRWIHFELTAVTEEVW
ncbi:MAG: hypothetical protein IKO52_10175 [Clostridia bacterium]|nr:hypothetical protein [Clostridia bacterium]